MTVTVVGLGKIGLPLAVRFAESGQRVIGADLSTRVVDQVRCGEPPFSGEDGLADRLRRAVAGGRLDATRNTREAVSTSEVVVVVVPLYVDASGAPDFATIDAATDDIGGGLRSGTLVVYETTVPVGTTRTRFTPRLEGRSGLAVGTDLSVAFSPERVSSGHVFADLRRYPKLVGGVDEASSQRAVAFYRSVLPFDDRDDLDRPNGVWDLGSAEAAELAKLAETTYRDVNIGLANQFALYADRLGVDYRDVARACNSQPFSHLHDTGIAVGGHCIPVYPWFYLDGDPTAALVRAGRATNEAMPEHSIALLAEHCPLSGARVVVLGASYRGGVKESAFSGVFATVAAIEARGGIATVADPWFSEEELERLGLRPYRGEPAEAAVLQADHPEFLGYTPADLPGVGVVLDGRRVLDPVRWPGVEVVCLAAGVRRPGHRAQWDSRAPMSGAAPRGLEVPSRSTGGAPSGVPASTAGLPGRSP